MAENKEREWNSERAREWQRVSLGGGWGGVGEGLLLYMNNALEKGGLMHLFDIIYQVSH